MAKVKIKQGKKQGVAMQILISVIISIAVVLLGAMILTALVSAGTVSETAYQTVAVVILAISAWAGSMAAMGGQPPVLAGAAAVYYLVLLSVNIILFDGDFSGIGWGTTAVILGVAAAFGMKAALTSGGGKRKIKYRYR